MTPAERYRTDPAFAELVERCAGAVGEPVGEVLRALGQLVPRFTVATTDIEQLLAEERARPSLPPIAAPTFRPGARRPGHKPASSVPPWARKRPIRPLPTNPSTS